MDVREQLRSATPDRSGSIDDAHRLYRRGRRRVVRRRAAAAVTATAAIVAGVVVVTGGGATSPVVDDDPGVVTTPDEPDPPPVDPQPEPGAEESDPPAGGQEVQVGEVVLTVPEGGNLEERDDDVLPCYYGWSEPTIVAMPSVLPEPLACDGVDGEPEATFVLAVRRSAVPPMFLPGHGDPEGGMPDEVELLGTTGMTEAYERSGGTPAVVYDFPDLDLYLEVDAPELDPDFVDELLASARLADDEPVDDGTDDGTDDQPETAPPLDDEPSIEDRQADPGGPSDLVLTDVTVGTHDGFDRVVLEFGGEGQVGWFTSLEDEAAQEGSGTPIEVAGNSVLEIRANMLAFPAELPDEASEWLGTAVAAPDDAGVLTEVVTETWFEGQVQIFLGLDEAVAYRIVRLEEPQRIAIDVLHP